MNSKPTVVDYTYEQTSAHDISLVERFVAGVAMGKEGNLFDPEGQL